MGKNHMEQNEPMELKATTLDDIAAVVGFSAALRLSAWYGDLGNVWVPREVDEGQLLPKLIGLSAAKRLSKEWGGEWLSIPRLSAYEDDVKRRTIKRMLERGFGAREVSDYVRLSERRVHQICRELEVIGLLEPVVPKRAKSAGKDSDEK
jgi:hypothetical protein